MATITADEKVLASELWREDPAYWMEEVLHAPFYAKQTEMIEAVRDHAMVAVVGCNSSGKDFAAGRIMLWWQNVMPEAKTVVIGPTLRQVRDILWIEARAGLLACPTRIGGRMTPRDSRYEHPEISPEHSAIGFSTDNPYNLTGWHAPNLLVIVTEAHNVTQSDIDAVKFLQPKRLLLTGNPFTDVGEFYEAFHTKADLYHGIEISAYDTPNLQGNGVVIPGMVSEEIIAQRAADWGKESPLFQASILGKFPDDLEDAIVTRKAVREAFERDLSEVPQEGRRKLSCDVARFGDDSTVVYFHHGNIARKVHKAYGHDLMRTTGFLVRLARKWDAQEIIIDDVGVGGGVTDRLKEIKRDSSDDLNRVRITPFNGGGKPQVEKINPKGQQAEVFRYANRITEAWLTAAKELYDGTVDLDDNPALLSQLTSRKKLITSSGDLRLEDKKDYKKRAARSPDDADAFCMGRAPSPPTPRARFLG